MMSTIPKLLRLSLRYEPYDTGERDIVEESHIIRVYDCYSNGSKDRGDKYRHYYLVNYISADNKGLIDPQFKICCSRGKIYYATGNNQIFKELKGTIFLYLYDKNDKKSSNVVIGRLEQLDMTI